MSHSKKKKGSIDVESELKAAHGKHEVANKYQTPSEA